MQETDSYNHMIEAFNESVANKLNDSYIRSNDKLYYQMNDISTFETTHHYEQVRGVLGKKHIRVRIESPFDFITIADDGVHAETIVNFRKYFNIPRGVAAQLLNISEPTMYRWIKGGKKLERNVSVQLFELTDLFLYGTEVFESADNFFKWLGLANPALGGLEPMELLEVPGGISKVRDLLGRIEFGVYS